MVNCGFSPACEMVEFIFADIHLYRTFRKTSGCGLASEDCCG